MIVISDSSPLILYAAIGQFPLLRALYTEILIPPAVWGEVVERGTGLPGSSEVANANWVRVQDPTDLQTVTTLRQYLGQGEAEAVALSLEMPEDVRVILDDLDTRRAARVRGRTVVGSAGILIRTNESGHIEHVRPLLVLLMQTGLYLSEPAIRQILESAGEI